MDNFQKMHVADNDINILLMGETGVGKSTFINAFANYMKYDKFQIAEKSEVAYLIPAKFVVTNENFDIQTVQIGECIDENSEVGESSTQRAKSYVFPIDGNKMRVRLIDTPGVGDTRGLKQDSLNFQNILNYVNKLERLHAVCFLLKPNNARLTVVFKYCIKQLLSILERSASKNIVFLFTNTRNTFYRPGDTAPALKKILSEITNVDIQFDKENVFCLDNEAFRFMVLCKNNITFSIEDRQSFSASWDQSVTECRRMINYVSGKGKEASFVPHLVDKTISTNEARNVIIQLAKPMSDIAELISDNVILLQRHKKKLGTEESSIKDLEDRLYFPIVDLETIPLKHPITVCTNSKCSEEYNVNGRRKSHYKQVCHNPCYLDTITQEMIGPPELINCYAIDHPSKLCGECGCDFSSHMHVYYLTKTCSKKIINLNVQMQIDARNCALENLKSSMEDTVLRIKEYEGEGDVIVKCMAKFANFLKQNAIVVHNDAFQDYIQYLVDREKSYGVDADGKAISYYQDLLKQYVAERSILDKALNTNDDNTTPLTRITSAEIYTSVSTLFSLKHTGQKIQDLHLEEYKLRSQELKHATEYVVDECVARSEDHDFNDGNIPESSSGQSRENLPGTPDQNNSASNSYFRFDELLKWFERK